MILRFLVKFSLLAILVAGAVFLYSQWKLDKNLTQLFASLNQQTNLNIRYETAKIDFSGEITLDSVEAYHPLFEDFFEASQIKLFAGSLYDILFSDANMKLSQLPENAHIIFNNAFVSFKSPNWLIGSDSPASCYEILEGSYCGSVKRLGMKEALAMGYDYLAFSGEVNYRLDRYSGSAIIKGFIDTDNYIRADYQINMGNIMAWQESVSAVSVGEPQKDLVMPIIELIDLNIQDQGYNKRKASYCSIKQSVAVEDYYVGHVNAVDKLMTEAGVTLTEELKAAYLQMIKPESNVHLYFQPKPNFDFSDFDAYEFNDFIKLSGLQLKINDEPVNRFIETGSFKEMAKIPSLVKQKEKAARKLKENEVYVMSKEFQPVSLQRVDRFVDYPIKIKLKNGKFYNGRLTRTSDSQLWVTVRKHGGELNLPLNRKDIKSMQVEVTVKSKQVLEDEE